jgi:epoxide hydrolase
MTDPTITPFSVHIGQAALDDLQRRLAATRFPAPAPDDSWDYGTPVGYLQSMVAAWQQFD